MLISEAPTEPAPSAEDPALLARAAAGDAAAFGRLTEPHQTRLFRQATALAGNESAAEDLVAETLIEAWKSLPRYQSTCQLSTWLYAILLHRHQKSLRRARSRPFSLAWLPWREVEDLQEQQANVPAPGLSPADALLQDETSARLRACIDALPDKHREIILLRFFADASLPDMAAVLGCSVGTVKSRLFNALEKLRQMKVNLPDSARDK